MIRIPDDYREEGFTPRWLLSGYGTVCKRYGADSVTGVDVDRTLEAAGYADWSYKDAHEGAALNLKPDETVVLNIKLAPLNGH